MRSTKGVVSVTKGERRSAKSTKARARERDKEWSQSASGERVRGIEIEDGENAVASKDREGGRGKEREGVIFAREGCAVRRAAAQNLGRAHFPPLSGSLSRPLFSLFFFYFFLR